MAGSGSTTGTGGGFASVMLKTAPVTKLFEESNMYHCHIPASASTALVEKLVEAALAEKEKVWVCCVPKTKGIQALHMPSVVMTCVPMVIDALPVNVGQRL